ncbi:MAG TPA: radical SAM protein [Syntrophales bacterium]|nr:radical SAM protein [Syntrophales bacterium]
MSRRLREKHRELLSVEKGVRKKLWGDRIPVCLVYPNVYRTGMSNLGFQTVYDLLNRHPSFLCERVFLPDPGETKEFSPGPPSLLSIESGRPPGDFDIVAFSVAYENDYLNILRILETARIPISAEERTSRNPLILGGGIAVTLNPEPLAPFFDLFLLGEGEDMILEFLDLYGTLRTGDTPRAEILSRIQRGIEGTYVPRFYNVRYGSDSLIESFLPADPVFPEKIRARHVADLNAFDTHETVLAKATEFGEMFLTEVSRGCARRCLFCAAGFACGPARFRSPERLTGSIEEGLRAKGKIGLLGTAVSDHPNLRDLCRFILNRGGTFSVGSMRADRLTAEIAKLLKETGVEMVSIAPEAGSQRLRDLIGKGITERHLFGAVEALIGQGIVNLRLYFMVGLPTEGEEDIEAIIDLTRRIKHHAVKITGGKKKFRRITLSINQFIPKAATPFQWLPLADTNVVRRRIRKISQALGRERSVTVTHDLPKWNYIQALLSLGDRRVSKLLLSAHQKKGNWAQAFKESHINPDFYVSREKNAGEILPWDFIDHGVSRDDLLKECRKALKGA